MRKLSLFFGCVAIAAVSVQGASPSARKLSQATGTTATAAAVGAGAAYGGGYSSGAYGNGAGGAYNSYNPMMPSNFDAMGAAALADIGTGGSLGLLVVTGEGTADVETANIAVTFKLEAKEFCHEDEYAKWTVALSQSASAASVDGASASVTSVVTVTSDDSSVNVTATSTDVSTTGGYNYGEAMKCKGKEATEVSSKAAKDILEAQDAIMYALGAKCLRKTATPIKVKPIYHCTLSYYCKIIGFEASSTVTCEARRSDVTSCIDAAKGCANKWVSVQVKKVKNVADDQQLAMGEMDAKRTAAANAALEARTLAKAITWMNDDSWHGREKDQAHGGGYPGWMTSNLGQQNYYSSYSVNTNPPEVFNATSVGSVDATGVGAGNMGSGPLPGQQQQNNDARNKQEQLQLVALVCFPKDEGLGLLGDESNEDKLEMYHDDSYEYPDYTTYSTSSVGAAGTPSAASMYPYSYPMPPMGIVVEVTVKCVLIVTLNNNEKNKQNHWQM